MMKATKPIAYVVHSVAADLGETSTKYYQKYLKWAFDCYRELNLFILPCIKTVVLTVNDNLTVDLPDDYVNYTAIGVKIGRHLYLLGRDDKLLFNQAEDCEVPIDQVVAKPDHFAGLFPYYYFFGGAFRNGQYVGEQYALGGGWSRKGYYRINESERKIQFGSMVPKTEVILEYKSTGVDCDGSVEIPYEAISAMTSFIHWQRIEHDESLKGLRTYPSQVQQKYGLWKSEFKKLKHYTLMFTVQEYLDSKYRTLRQTPKR